MAEPFDLHEAAFEAVHRWWKAWVERDERVVERMASSDYVERNDMGRLRALDAGRLAEMVSRDCAECAITEWELSDPVTRVFEHVTVCSYAFRFSARRGSRSFTYQGRATDVLSRVGDEWFFVSHEGILETGRLAG